MKFDILKNSVSPLLHTEYLKPLFRVQRYSRLKARCNLDMDFAAYYPEYKKLKYANAVPNVGACYRGINKYNKPSSCGEIKEADQLLDWLDRSYGHHVTSRLLTFDEAADGLESGTSPGFPWNKDFKTKGEALQDSKTRECVKFLVENFDKLQRPRCIWSSSLKEEAREIAKLADNNIRQFSAAPLELAILGRMLFRDQNESFYSSHLNTSSAVGISTRSGGWARAWCKLSKHKRGFELDAKQWDSSLVVELFRIVRDLRIRWHIRAEQGYVVPLVRAYYEELIEAAYILPDGCVIQKFLGNPSGSPTTVDDNTLILDALLRLTYIRRVGGTFTDYEAHVSALLYGDDNTFSCDESIIDRFNGQAVLEECKTVGVTIKPEGTQPKPVADLTFLSFGFIPFGSFCIPRYTKPQKLLASLAYRDRHYDPAMKLQRALAIRELLFGTQEFDIVDGFVLRLYNKYQYMPTVRQTMQRYLNKEQLIRLFVPYEGGTPPLKQ